MRRVPMPRPGRAHDLIYPSELRSPSQFITRFRRVANKGSWIASASITNHDRYGQAGHPFNRVNNFLNRESVPIAEIVNRGPAAIQERTECFDVGLRQVRYVDVVSNARPIVCRVVGSEHCNVHSAAGSRIEQQGNQMGFGIVRLPDLIVRDLRPPR